MRQRIPAVLLVAVMLAGVAAYVGIGRVKDRRPRTLPLVGYQAPDFSLQGVDDKSYRLDDYRGKVVFLNFWASW